MGTQSRSSFSVLVIECLMAMHFRLNKGFFAVNGQQKVCIFVRLNETQVVFKVF